MKHVRQQPVAGTLLTARKDFIFALPKGKTKKFRAGEEVPRKLLSEREVWIYWRAFLIDATLPVVEAAAAGA